MPSTIGLYTNCADAVYENAHIHKLDYDSCVDGEGSFAAKMNYYDACGDKKGPTCALVETTDAGFICR